MFDIIKCAKAAVYHNTASLTPAKIKEATGCTHIMNGWVFNGQFKPLSWLVIDGKVIAKDQYNDWGFVCDKTGAPVMSVDRTKSFLSGVPLLKDGMKLVRTLTPDMARKAERTAVAWLSDGRVLLWCDKATMVVDDLVKKLVSLGAVDALLMDGGGSTQGIFPDGKVTSTRKVPTLLLFWEEDPEPKGEKPMVEINAYSKAKDGNKKLSTNFKVKEFACSDGTDPIFIAPELVEILQKIRTHFKKSVNINSAYRTVAKNKAVGGATYSQHLYGTAADISIKGVTPKQVAAYAETLMPQSGGIGVYSTFTHIDVREVKSRWNG